MTFPKARLAVAALLLLGWLGFLLFLVVDAPRIIVSKPQFLSAQVYVIADVTDENGAPSATVVIDEVMWAASPDLRQLAKKTLKLADLPGCLKTSGYHGSGKYILPLRRVLGSLEIAPVPWFRGYHHGPATHLTLESAGLPPPHLLRRVPIAEALERKKALEDAGHKVALADEELRIYANTPEVRSQVEKLAAAK
ncbi:MAG: hypothetical protein HYR84_01190 [Planctomycetes bacterium]|nr:hypothetical protein [Planctomycetota bacterium]